MYDRVMVKKGDPDFNKLLAEINPETSATQLPRRARNRLQRVYEGVMADSAKAAEALRIANSPTFLDNMDVSARNGLFADIRGALTARKETPKPEKLFTGTDGTVARYGSQKKAEAAQEKLNKVFGAHYKFNVSERDKKWFIGIEKV